MAPAEKQTVSVAAAAYAKVVLHAAKYPAQNIGGVLLGRCVSIGSICF